MSHDTLTTLVKVRRLACDEAMRSLVQALDLESQALQSAHAIERAIAQETETASDLASPDAVVEAFGQWLLGARRQLDAATHTLQDRQAETTRKRAELTACRTALEIVETLQTERREAAAAARAQKLQRDLDDRPQRRHGDGRGGLT